MKKYTIFVSKYDIRSSWLNDFQVEIRLGRSLYLLSLSHNWLLLRIFKHPRNKMWFSHSDMAENQNKTSSSSSYSRSRARSGRSGHHHCKYVTWQDYLADKPFPAQLTASSLSKYLPKVVSTCTPVKCSSSVFIRL